MYSPPGERLSATPDVHPVYHFQPHNLIASLEAQILPFLMLERPGGLAAMQSSWTMDIRFDTGGTGTSTVPDSTLQNIYKNNRNTVRVIKRRLQLKKQISAIQPTGPIGIKRLV